MNKQQLYEQYFLAEDPASEIEAADQLNKIFLEEYGAGFEGTDTLRSNYGADTPGQIGKKRKPTVPKTEIKEDAVPTNAVGGGAIAGGGYNGPSDIGVHRKHHKRKRSISKEKERLAELNLALSMLRRTK